MPRVRARAAATAAGSYTSCSHGYALTTHGRIRRRGGPVLRGLCVRFGSEDTGHRRGAALTRSFPRPLTRAGTGTKRANAASDHQKWQLARVRGRAVGATADSHNAHSARTATRSSWSPPPRRC